VWSYAERGEFTLAERHGRLAVDLAEELTHPFNRAHVYYDLGYLHLIRGQFDAADRVLTQAVGLIEKWGLTYLSPFTMGFLGFAHVQSGRIEEGLALLEKALERYEKIGLGLFKSLVAIQLSDAYLRAGRTSDASACLDRALQIAHDRGERGHEAHGLFVQGEIAARTEPLDEDHALRSYSSALRRAEELGMEPLAARCHMALGRLFSGAKSNEASEHTLKAKELLRGLGLEPSDRTVK
jgi:tetratricopeptide (TPR) repeat protein